MAPFPWLPMIAISTGLISHSYALTNLFPYVGFMVQDMGVTDDKDKAGYYAGFMSSAFMFGRFSSSYFWGRIADQYGRLPVFRIALWTMVIVQIGFGLSTNFYWAVVFRLLLGMFNGILAASKTMICEICGPEHEVVGMGFITATWSIGYVIGPAVGGLLAEPATTYPEFYSESGIFGRYPYLLPNLVGAALGGLALCLTHLFLRETHPVYGAQSSARRRIGFTLLSRSEAEADDAEAAEQGGRKPPSHVAHASVAVYGRGPQESPSPRGLVSVGRALPEKREAPRTSMDSTTAVSFPKLATEGSKDMSAVTSDLEESYQCNGDDRHEGEEGTVCEQQGEHQHGGYGSMPRSKEGDSGHAHGEERGVEDSERRGALDCRRECVAPALLLAEKRVQVVVLIFSLYSFVYIGFQEVYPLWALSSVARGGLDWRMDEIGKALSLVGVAMMVYQVCIFPIVLKRVGMTITQRLSSVSAIPMLMAVPLLNHLRDNQTTLEVATVVVVFLAHSLCNAVFVSVSVVMNNVVSADRRGELNGLGMMVGSLAKAIGPFFFAVVFAWSIERPRPFPFGSHLAFILMGLGMLLVAVIGWNTIVRHEDFSAPGARRKGDAETELVASPKPS